MAIHSLERRSDPRVVCGLLASSVLKRLGHPGKDEDFAVFLRNLIRLLELYRFGTFSEHKHRGILQRGPLGANKSSDSFSSEAMSAVKDALEQAHKEVFGDQSSEYVANYLTGIFESLETGQHVEPDDLELARRFLEVLNVRIQAQIR